MQNHAPTFRCDLCDFLLDLLDFMEEQIEQAVSDPADQAAGVDAVAGVIPLLKTRLDGGLWTSFLLAFGNKIEGDDWKKEWDKLANMKPQEFREATKTLVDREEGVIEHLRKSVLSQLV